MPVGIVVEAHRMGTDHPSWACRGRSELAGHCASAPAAVPRVRWGDFRWGQRETFVGEAPKDAPWQPDPPTNPVPTEQPLPGRGLDPKSAPPRAASCSRSQPR